MSAYCSWIERQTASLLSLSLPAERGEGDEPETQGGKRQRVSAAAGRFLHPCAGLNGDSTDDREEGRAGVPWPAHPSSVVT